MRVLVTGITGFLGRHLGKELVKRGHDVFGLARYVSDRDTSDLLDIDIRYGDILDSSCVRGVLRAVQPDVIVHFATQSSVEYSFNNPYEEYNVGFIGTTNVAQAAMETLADLRKFIFPSSVEVYGNQATFPIKEDQPLKPASPYGVAKVAAEYFLKYLYEGYRFPCMIFRSTNTYGRKHNHNFVVEHIIFGMLTREDVLMGDPTPVRDFLYVDDEVEAYVKAIEADTDLSGQVMNTGTGTGTSIAQLVDIIRKMVDFEGKVRWKETSRRPFEIRNLTIDAERIRTRLQWFPRHSLEEGLQETINWWRHHLDRSSKR